MVMGHPQQAQTFGDKDGQSLGGGKRTMAAGKQRAFWNCRLPSVGAHWKRHD